MTAGSGIIHDEGRNHPGGKLHGFQMWINLPKKHKWIDPAYRTIRSKEKPHYTYITYMQQEATLSLTILYQYTTRMYAFLFAAVCHYVIYEI